MRPVRFDEPAGALLESNIEWEVAGDTSDVSSISDDILKPAISNTVIAHNEHCEDIILHSGQDITSQSKQETDSE